MISFENMSLSVNFLHIGKCYYFKKYIFCILWLLSIKLYWRSLYQKTSSIHIGKCYYVKNTFSEDPHTKKQVLFNDIIKYLKNANCLWKNTEVASSGNNLIQALTNTLWTIDGHHFVFFKQGFNFGLQLSNTEKRHIKYNL